MEITQTFYAETRGEWRAWLEKHHASSKEIWLVFYKKHSGKPRVAYDDAVEEALCFGWIDSLVKGIDEDRYAQKFTPRKPGSAWSDSNKIRIGKLLAAGKMRPAGLKSIEGLSLAVAKKKKSGPVTIPPDLAKALAADKTAGLNFASLTDGYVRLCLLWIDTAKKDETRQKRIREFVSLTARGEKIGLK